MFERRERSEKQDELWVPVNRLPAAVPSAFYRRVEATLDKMGFARKVWDICEPAYADPSRGGRPGIDPVVYLKMLMIGFFENLPSDRAIAARCEDSLSARGFLGYAIGEATPDHSSFTVIRDRLGVAQLEAIHGVLLATLHAHGLLRGRKLGIDSSVIEANASLRALEHRDTEESYWEYVRRLAAEAGLDPDDTKAVRRFDKKREGRRTSNKEWQNPHDPEAKVGRTKDGACDITYKPEHVTDLESGAIVQVEVRPGDAADNDESLCERVLAAVGTLHAALPEQTHEKLGSELCGDEGYFALRPMARLQELGVRTVVGDPQAGRRKLERVSAPERAALRRASRSIRSASGKALLRKRGEHLERSFAHMLDHGGLRRATLRGCEKLTKRHMAAALTYNLSLLMRTLFPQFRDVEPLPACPTWPLEWHLDTERWLNNGVRYIGICGGSDRRGGWARRNRPSRARASACGRLFGRYPASFPCLLSHFRSCLRFAAFSGTHSRSVRNFPLAAAIWGVFQQAASYSQYNRPPLLKRLKYERYKC